VSWWLKVSILLPTALVAVTYCTVAGLSTVRSSEQREGTLVAVTYCTVAGLNTVRSSEQREGALVAVTYCTVAGLDTVRSSEQRETSGCFKGHRRPTMLS
jgi:hypothetical protein